MKLVARDPGLVNEDSIINMDSGDSEIGGAKP